MKFALRPPSCGVASLGLATVLLLASGEAAAVGAGINPYACGPISPPGQFGPFDYRTVTNDVRHLVENTHFPPKVEQQLEGNSGPFGGDVDYTLRAFPNNPRALMSLSRFSLLRHIDHAPGARYSTECYFERAIRWQPSDPLPHLIYAIYLKDRKRTGEMREQLDEAERLRGNPSNFDLDYNLGLMYFDVGAYDKSLLSAKRAYALGASFPALQKKLKTAGKWNDDPLPVDAPAAEVPKTPAAVDSPDTEKR